MLMLGSPAKLLKMHQMIKPPSTSQPNFKDMYSVVPMILKPPSRNIFIIVFPKMFWDT